MLNPLLAFALLFFTIFLIIWIYRPTKSTLKNLPPSPPRLPILGNLHQLGKHPHRSLQRLARRYGDLMMLQLGTKPVLIVSSPDSAREIMKDYDTIFCDRPKLAGTHRLLYQGKDVTAAPYGEYWRRMRSICVLQLLSHKRVQSFRGVREQELGLLVDNVKHACLVSMPVNLSELFASHSIDVICRVAFGSKFMIGGGAKRFKELIGEFTKLVGVFNVGDFIPWLAWVNNINGFDSKVEEVAKGYDEFLDAVIEEHLGVPKMKGKSSASDFVDVLLEYQEQNIGGSSIDRDGIKGLMMDMFAGGTGTTFTVLEWTMAQLLRHPRVMKKVQNEMMTIANGKPDITESDLDQVHYLKAVIKETLRIYPPIPLLAPRLSTEDVKIKGYDIAAGTMVLISAWTMGRDPSLWDEPDEFRPERFLNSDVDFKGHHFQFIPFGGGRRGCPGIFFAISTIELVLANVVHRFDWTLPAGAKAGEDLDMTESNGLVIHREDPLIALPKLRSF